MPAPTLDEIVAATVKYRSVHHRIVSAWETAQYVYAAKLYQGGREPVRNAPRLMQWYRYDPT